MWWSKAARRRCHAKETETAVLVASTSDDDALRLTLKDIPYGYPRGRADTFTWSLGAVGGPANSGFEIAISYLSRKLGLREQSPGPCASTIPGMIRRERVVMPRREMGRAQQ